MRPGAARAASPGRSPTALRPVRTPSSRGTRSSRAPPPRRRARWRRTQAGRSRPSRGPPEPRRRERGPDEQEQPRTGGEVVGDLALFLARPELRAKLLVDALQIIGIGGGK